MNPAKNKGDRYERLAVQAVVGLLPDLCVPNPMRKLGAGRKDDTGDLHVLADTAIQVKAYKDPVTVMAATATAAQHQARNGLLPHHVGMLWVPRSRQHQVQWLFVCREWPVNPPGGVPVVTTPRQAAREVCDDLNGPRSHRVVAVSRGGQTMLVSTGEAWALAYREGKSA